MISTHTQIWEERGCREKSEEKHNHWLVWNAASAFLGLSACLRSFLPTLLYNTPLRHLSDLAIAFFSDTSPQNSSATLLYTKLFSNTFLGHFSASIFFNTSLQHSSPTCSQQSSSTLLCNHSSPALQRSSSTLLYNTLLLHFSIGPFSILFQHL